ncbi:MAG TPA: hypothetical protein VHY20_15690 [Pirellulales bacterium]|jgi:hypothetical protein|nr:hypothetical protein [Pirellulales bacterium]
MNQQPEDARALRIAEIRRQIYEGTYDTPGRLAVAVERFVERALDSFDLPAADEPQSDR